MRRGAEHGAAATTTMRRDLAPSLPPIPHSRSPAGKATQPQTCCDASRRRQSRKGGRGESATPHYRAKSRGGERERRRRRHRRLIFSGQALPSLLRSIRCAPHGAEAARLGLQPFGRPQRRRRTWRAARARARHSMQLYPIPAPRACQDARARQKRHPYQIS